MDFRTDRDSMGEVKVPALAYYGPSTQRAHENFPISGIRFSRRFIWALGMIKGAAAGVAGRDGHIPAEVAAAIEEAAAEVREGRLDEHFPLDIFQTGSGTSTNTNANEVIARRASEIMSGDAASNTVHANDHVNFGQSSNDVIPTAIHLAAVAGIRQGLLPALDRLATALETKAAEFENVVKSGRTHLMDATPITLGQEFSGYAAQARGAENRLHAVLGGLEELALGGTAVGTGLNAPPGFAAAVINLMSEWSGYSFVEAKNHFEAQASKDAAVMASGALKTIGTSLFKIANDLRWMGSGPSSGIGEINIPDLQPGSSIMPGKVNPVMAEMVMMVAAQVFGNDTAITWAAANGNFELNVMMPVLAHNLLQSIEILTTATTTFAERCVEGITANEERIRELLERNVIIVTALNPYIGYDNGAIVAKECLASGRSVREIVLEKGLMTAEELDRALQLERLTEGGLA
ncbi:MAG TPA: class II fumarate hydratase [Acidimicrobiia bacterium]|nr:class II fumarate hydratase [Acidimicrobiia bacterium]